METTQMSEGKWTNYDIYIQFTQEGNSDASYNVDELNILC
jgi:hypothetical protein